MSLKVIVLLCMCVCAVNALSQSTGKCTYKDKEYKVGKRFKINEGCKCKCKSGETVSCKGKTCPCTLNGQWYNIGAIFQNKDGCKCTCKSNGKVKCRTKRCNPHCKYDGKKYKLGDVVPSSDKCMHCECISHGAISCKGPVCPAVYCEYPVKEDGECCPKCDTVVCIGDDKKTYSPGDVVPSSDKCLHCECSSNGAISCMGPICPAVYCENPVKEDGECCPKCDTVMCIGDDKKTYSPGEVIPSSDKCMHCVCMPVGIISCSGPRCAVNCENPEYVEGECCPVCPDPVCYEDGKSYLPGETMSSDPCSPCECSTNGEKICLIIDCFFDGCENPIYIEGQCCPICNTSECIGDDGKTYSPGENVPTNDECLTCTCEPNGLTSCHGPSCAWNCENPVTVEGQCCPVCIGCVDNGKTYQEGEQISGDKCNGCVCGKDHNPVCIATDCMYLSDCGDKEPATPVGQCCPVCPRDDQCSYNGVLYDDGDSFKDKCNSCFCSNGAAACTKMFCADEPAVEPLPQVGDDQE